MTTSCTAVRRYEVNGTTPVFLSAVLVLGVIFAAFTLLVPRDEIGYICTVCGAHKKANSRPIGHSSLFYSETIEDNAVSRIRERLLGKCFHDWEFAYGQSRSLWGGEVGCGKPELTFQIGLLPDCLGAGLTNLPSDTARRQALTAIGDRNNELRNLAAAAVRELASSEVKTDSPAAKMAWWKLHQELFVPSADRRLAIATARKWSQSDDGQVQSEADTFLSRSKGR